MCLVGFYFSDRYCVVLWEESGWIAWLGLIERPTVWDNVVLGWAQWSKRTWLLFRMKA